MKPRKITPELKTRLIEEMKTKTRSEICREHGLDFHMLRREFGPAWTHSPKAPTQTGATQEVA